MAGHPGLTRGLAALAAAVLLAHGVVIDWATDHLRTPQRSQLRTMAPVMYTRMLAPTAAAPVAPPAAAPRRQAPVRRAPVKKPAAHPAPPPAAPSPSQDEVLASAPPPAAVEPPPAPSPPLEAAPETQAVAQPAPPEPAAPPAIAWPGDTRLNYRLSGQFRSGPLFGDAKVLWQREGSRYQVKVEVDVTLWLHWTMTSQGELGPAGLLPHLYEEERRGKRRSVRVENGLVLYEGGRSQPQPAGVQDTASQFIELGQRFTQGTAPLEVGRTVDVWLARPGGVDLWTYDVVGIEPLALDKLGTVAAYHLKPRAIANARGNITAEIWYAPSLQYLPVRIRINTGEADYLDLAVQAIEQR